MALLGNICGKNFLREIGLKAYMLMHACKRCFKCDKCYKAYFTKSKLQRHQVLHEDKKYCCEFCNQRFSYMITLENYIRNHTNERPHKCHLCSKTFQSSSGLFVHLKSHTFTPKDRRYECHTCGKRFVHGGRLSSHRKTHLSEEARPIPCNTRCYSNSLAQNHILRHINEKPFFASCVRCLIQIHHPMLHIWEHMWEISSTFHFRVIHARNNLKQGAV